MLHLSDDDVDLLCKAPLFAGIGCEAVFGLLEGAVVAPYAENSLLFNQGDRADRFFLVLEGRVNLFALTDKGDQSIIEVFEKGRTFAEAAMFSSGKFPLNAEVAAGSRLLHVPVAPFLRRLSENRDLAFKMLAALSRWQHHLLTEIAELKSRSPIQRLATFLLSLASSEEGPVGIRLPMTKTVLASRIGIAPESLSRAIARLRSVGVESRGRSIFITDVAALRRFCEESSED